jgi:hypothetical protein
MESNITLKNHNINDIDDLKNYAASVYNELYPKMPISLTSKTGKTVSTDL